MSHLSLETMARLVGEAPDASESAHLSSCAECSTQLAAMTEDVHALAMLPDMDAAPDQWDALERRLTAEGLIRTPARRFGAHARMMQIAAALVLFVGGAMAGRISAPELAPVTANADRTTDVPAATEPPAASPQGTLASGTTSEPAATVPMETPAADPRNSVTLASTGSMDMPRPQSVDEAAQYVRATEAMYLDALTRLAELASNSETGDPVARLAALQSIIMTTQAALNETPTDPVINGYHLTALAQRDATLRQVAMASGQQWY